MAHSLDALRDFTPFMNQARLVVQSVQGSPDAAVTYQQITELAQQRLPEWGMGQLDGVVQQYEVDGAVWHELAPRVLEIDRLFGSIGDPGFVLANLIRERLPENHALQPWHLPGGKKVSNLAQIWTDPSLGKLVGMIKRTAALFMRYLRGSYTSWKLAGLAHGENAALFWGVFSKGYDLEWRKGSSDEFVDWLISWSGQGEQFPKLRAALSGVLFPKKGEHFVHMSFQPFFQEVTSPGVSAMYNVMGRVKAEIAPVNETMRELKEFFENSRTFREELNLGEFNPLVQRLLTACRQFENVNFKENN